MFLRTESGISTVSGNQVIDNMTNNTLKILHSIGFISESVVSNIELTNESPVNELAYLRFEECLSHGGLKVPVIEGCGIPFLGKPVTASYIHGNTGLEGI